MKKLACLYGRLQNNMPLLLFIIGGVLLIKWLESGSGSSGGSSSAESDYDELFDD